MKTSKCIQCERNFKNISEEGLCYYCYFQKYKKVPKEFQPRGKYTG